MILTSQYTFLGSSRALTSRSGTNYYLLSYAKAVAKADRSGYTVTQKSVLASNGGASFYQYRSSLDVTADSEEVHHAANMPAEAWELEPFKENGVQYRKGTVLNETAFSVTTEPSCAKTFLLKTEWTLKSGTADYLPPVDVPATVSGSVTLPVLPSAFETTVSASVLSLGDRLTMNVVKAVECDTYRWTVNLNGTEILITETQALSAVWTPSLELAETYSLPRSQAVTVGCAALKNGQTVQSTCHILTLTVPETDDTKPNVSLTLEPVSTLPEPFDDLYLKGKSAVKVTVHATSKYGATISAGSTKFQIGETVYESGTTSALLDRSGEVTVIGYATDNRGYTGTATATIVSIPYEQPRPVPYNATEILCERCDVSGHKDTLGAYLHIKAARHASSVMIEDVEHNLATLSYRKTNGTWTTLLSECDTADGVDMILGNVVDNVSQLYQIEIRCADAVGESKTVTFAVPAGDCPLHLAKGGRSVGIGQMSEGGSNRIYIGWQTHFNKGIVPRTIWEPTESDPSWSGISAKPCEAWASEYTVYLVRYSVSGTHKTALLLRTGSSLGAEGFQFTISDAQIYKMDSVGSMEGLYALI